MTKPQLKTTPQMSSVSAYLPVILRCTCIPFNLVNLHDADVSEEWANLVPLSGHQNLLIPDQAAFITTMTLNKTIPED